jgi:hypothetical protein
VNKCEQVFKKLLVQVHGSDVVHFKGSGSPDYGIQFKALILI